MSFLRTILIKNDCQLKQRELLTANWFMNIAWERYDDMHEIRQISTYWVMSCTCAMVRARNILECSRKKIFSKQFGGNISI